MTNTTPHLVSVQMREEYRNKDYYYAHYSNGLTTILHKEDHIVVQWLEEGNTPAPYIAPAPGPDYLSFWNALTTSTVYGSIREQSFTSLPMNTLATEFIALLGDAKAGRPNETAIQSSISAILTTGTFTEEHLNELQEALESGHLQDIYTLPQ